MSTKKHFGLLLLAAASISGVSALAVAKAGTSSTSTTLTTSTPTTSTILTPDIAPSLITAKPTGGSTYALFFMNKKKIKLTAAQEMAVLSSQLSVYGISPCRVTTDINGTPISCGAGLVSFGANQLYSYTTPINLVYLRNDSNRGIKQVYAANFLSPNGLIPGDSVGRPVHVHFNQPVTQFAMNIDSGQLDAPSIENVQFVVGAVGSQVSLTQALTPGTGQWVGVQAPNGITDLDVIGLGSTQAYSIDQFTVVPK